jgi:hypothetical protein
MRKNKKETEPIPRHFKSTEEAAEFRDTHDLGDCRDLTKEVNFETDIRRRVFLTATEPQLAKRLGDYAHQQGISTETMINVRLGEKLAAAVSCK